MKQVKNKMTGDIGELDFDSKEGVFIVVRYDLLTKVTSKSYYKNLKDLNEEWEDYEEPKEWWYIDIHGPHKVTNNDEYYQQVKAASKQIGNYFETKEEAEKAVEKLKAWKRLKDKGFRFNGKEVFSEGLLEIDGVLPALKRVDNAERIKIIDDLDICFGGEDE